MSNNAELVLISSAQFIKEQAINLRDELIQEGKGDDFKEGILFGYMRVLSVIKSDALAHNYSLKEIGLLNFDPENELLI